MEVGFDDPELRDLLEDRRALRRRFGARRAGKLEVRLAALHAATDMADLRSQPGRWHPLTGDREGHWAADLDHPYRLLVRPAEPVPWLDAGGIDWGRVTRAVVVTIVDYH